MNPRSTTLLIALLSSATLTGTAQAELFDRGGGLIYDDELNVTWLQDANYAKTSGYVNPALSPTGVMKWQQATSWAAGLSYYDSVRNVTYDDWRLPHALPVNGISYVNYERTNGTSDLGYNIISPDSELSHLFYIGLGNPGSFPGGGTYKRCFMSNTDTCLDNVGPFINLDQANSSIYRYGTEYKAGATGESYAFNMVTGAQIHTNKGGGNFTLALRDGDVAAVPEAETWAMLLAGLGLVGAVVRRNGQALA